MSEQPKKRPVQPRCEVCAHPISFHSGQEGHSCAALGCECKGFIFRAEGQTLPDPDAVPA